MDALTYLHQLKEHGVPVVSVTWAIEAFEAERSQTSAKVPQSRFQTTDEYLQVRELERTQRASMALKTNHTYDPEVERQIQEYALMKKSSRSS